MKKILGIPFILMMSFTFPSVAHAEKSAPFQFSEKVKAQQILLDLGGGGGEEANLPGTKWWFAETPNGKPFFFWTWAP